MRAKILAVVAGSSILGIGLGRLVADAITVARNERANPPRAAKAAAPARGAVVGASLSNTNFGGPGKLAVKGTFYIIGKPAASRDKRYEVVMSVKDLSAGVYVIEEDPVGFCEHRAGAADLEQDFEAVYELPPGRYAVDMFLREPEHMITLPNGDRLPFAFRSRRAFTVR